MMSLDILINNDPVNPEIPVYAPNFPETGGGDNENTQESPCGAEISVLFLYTQQLKNSGADIEQSALIGIENLNETLKESKTPNTHVKVSIAGYALWSEYNDNSSIASSILENMRTSTEVLNLRDEYDADLVILIQKSDLIHENKPIGGLAYVNEYAGIDYAFSVCNFSNTANPKLIGHEIGHLFGCRHLDGGHHYANAFEWNEGTISSGFIYRSTLMNTTFNGSILRFSNPNNQFNGFVIGTNERNNSKMIAKNACTISGFGGRVVGGYEDPPYYSFIVGPTYVYRDQYSTFTWSPLSYGCPGNNECYHWEISWNGGVSFEYFGNTESVTLNGLNVPTNVPVIFLKLTSTCFENGLTDVSFYEVKNWSAQNINNDIAIENRVREKSDLKIYPIPSNQELTVEFSIERPSNVQINLISQNGQKNAVISKTIADAGLQIFSINIESFINGFYLMELKMGEELLYHPIIISK